jgi:endonuclease/exonuclease/phosphatase family metal-dependent hydrolase
MAMRIVSWNLHGAAVAGRATNVQQAQAWEYMREVLGADVILAQEASETAVPHWVTREWAALVGERSRYRKNWRWGSVIAAKPEWPVREQPDWWADPWLAQLYDLVLVGRIDIPGNGPTIVASVHTAALPVADFVRDYAKTLVLSVDVLDSLRRPGCQERPFINDLAFTALARMVEGERFIVAGDWNTCRPYRGGSEFFARAASRGWVECHKGPEEPSYFGPPAGTYQLDHAFCDSATGSSVTSCQVVVDETVRSVSDHAPLVLDLEPTASRSVPRAAPQPPET